MCVMVTSNKSSNGHSYPHLTLPESCVRNSDGKGRRRVSCAGLRHLLGGSRRRQAFEQKRKRGAGYRPAPRRAVCCVDRATDHQHDQEDVINGQVAADRSGGFGVAEGFLQQLTEALPAQIERRPQARVLSSELAQRMKT